ncbi:sterol desaturase family protein [Ferruginibacter sp. HRS2-29]|uniref:sterol desaturase family protein n=1 Tax=Ferruginibacter sp. HRS2-29 TaxID=2487334 RepID=UPI0020CC87FC|nr:sterol desaturase family protein [Ferruginibacter sp. HRS2-29]MCP9751897.1 sterol desaturase family protein [Ferruginibacter sp. HRS2-29]
MENYGKILLIAMPAFLLLVLFEKWYGWRKGKDTVRHMDMISSLNSGVTNVTKDVLGLVLAILTYEQLVNHIALTHIKATWLTYVVAFIALDFAGYVVHAIDHKVNFFWNSHLVHHSSEEFNLACALRQSISVFVRLFAILLLPAALLGVPVEVIALVGPLHLFAQFWYHTQHIGKMGFLEKIIVTPSHHRVHHAINKEYIDKNYGQILIIWDKLFGTFQEELKEAPPVYGITRPVQTWNPIKINFQHMSLLIKDAWRTKSWKDKAAVFYKPTGWRPADVEEKYPVFKIENVYSFEKYDTVYSRPFLAWTWLQMIVLLLMVSYLFGNIRPIGIPEVFVYGAFIFLFVYALTESMDQNPNAYIWEIAKALFGTGIIFYFGDWFGADKISPVIKYVIAGYLFISSAIVTQMSLAVKPVGDSKRDMALS